MDLSTICKMQIDDDEKRGFPVKFKTDKEIYTQITKDLVGLFGEIGEFSEIAKKIGLKLDTPKYDGPTIDESRGRLGKELSDILIYTIRLAAVVDIDLESTVIRTIKENKDRYAYLE